MASHKPLRLRHVHFVVPKLLLVPIAHGFVQNVWTGFAIYRPRPIYICFPKLWLDHPMPWTFFQMKWSGQEFWLQLVSSQSVSWAPSTLNFDYIYSMFLFKRHWLSGFDFKWSLLIFELGTQILELPFCFTMIFKKRSGQLGDFCLNYIVPSQSLNWAPTALSFKFVLGKKRWSGQFWGFGFKWCFRKFEVQCPNCGLNICFVRLVFSSFGVVSHKFWFQLLPSKSLGLIPNNYILRIDISKKELPGNLAKCKPQWQPAQALKSTLHIFVPLEESWPWLHVCGLFMWGLLLYATMPLLPERTNCHKLPEFGYSNVGIFEAGVHFQL